MARKEGTISVGYTGQPIVNAFSRGGFAFLVAELSARGR